MRFSAFSLGIAAILPLIASSAQAQQTLRPGPITQSALEQEGQRQTTTMQGTPRAGKVADSTVGQVGQRQNAASIQAEPMSRINNRIANRVQNRIRNRIDRSYDPTANTTSPFEVAAEQTTRGQPEQ